MRVTMVIDPGLNRSGVAVFEEGTLTNAGTLEPPKGLSIIEKNVWIARHLLSYMRSEWLDAEVELVGEWPKIYKHGKGKGDPNDLPPLSGIVGACAGVLALMYDAKCYTYLPKEWSASTKKFETVKGATISPRAKAIRRRLTTDETPVWDAVKYHDTVDAIGIGLHHLGRSLTERVRVFPRE